MSYKTLLILIFLSLNNNVTFGMSEYEKERIISGIGITAFTATVAAANYATLGTTRKLLNKNCGIHGCTSPCYVFNSLFRLNKFICRASVVTPIIAAGFTINEMVDYQRDFDRSLWYEKQNLKQ